MCSNYLPAPANDLLQFGRGAPDFIYGHECYPQQSAPFLCNSSSHWLPGVFGLLPHWAKPVLARRTYNARSETVATLPSFRAAWRRRQLAIIPVQAFFEPNYETGRAVRWRIGPAEGNGELVKQSCDFVALGILMKLDAHDASSSGWC